MSQYTTGTIDLTNGSASVVGNGTLWVTNGQDTLAPNLRLWVPGEPYLATVQSITGEGAASLAAPWPGSTLNAVQYRLHNSFGPLGIAILDIGDLGTLPVIDDSLRIIEQELQAAGVSVAQWDILGRISAGSGAASGQNPMTLTEEPSPAAGHYLLGWVSGALRIFNVGNLPAGGGGASSLDQLSDVTISAVGNLEVLQFDSGSGDFINRTLAEAGIVPTSRQMASQHSVQGGGDLSADRTYSLVGDVASPGNDKVYGTDPGGTKGWQNAGIRSISTTPPTPLTDGATVGTAHHSLSASGTVLTDRFWLIEHDIDPSNSVNVTVQNTIAAGTRIVLMRSFDQTGPVTITPQSPGEIDGSTDPITIPDPGQSVALICDSNPGTAPVMRVEGTTTQPTKSAAAHDFAANVVSGNLAAQVTDADARTVADADTGKTLIYTGAGHTWTFNAANLTAGAHGMIRNAGSGTITVSTDGTEKFTGTEPIPVDASAVWEWDGTRLWLDVNA